MAKIDSFSLLMNAQGASDLHLASGNQPALRVRGDLERMNFGVIENLLKQQMVLPEEVFEFANKKERFVPYLPNIPEEYQIPEEYRVPEEYRELLEHMNVAQQGTPQKGGARRSS